MAISKSFGLLAATTLVAGSLVGCSAASEPCPDSLQPALALLSTTQAAEVVPSFSSISPISVPEASCAFKVNQGGQVIGFWMNKDAAFVDQIKANIKQSGYVAINESDAYFSDGNNFIGVGYVDENGETPLTALDGLVNSAAIIMIMP